MSKTDRLAADWAAWHKTLTRPTRDLLRAEAADQPLRPVTPCDTEEHDAYHRFRALLTAGAREWLDSTVQEDGQLLAANTDVSVVHFGLVESPDGEWLTTRLFTTAEALAKRLGQLEGTDTVVQGFVGLPLHITKGPQRYLLIPGAEKAIMIPMYEGGPCRHVSADVLDGLELQDDGFLGPKELIDTMVVEKLTCKNTPDEDDEDDEEDDADTSDAS